MIHALYEKVECQKAMGMLAERLGHAAETARLIQRTEIRYVFIANLLLYQKSLYTHLGDQHKMESITDAFHAATEKIENDVERDNLWYISSNRRLVDLTDSFDYDTAMHEFEEIKCFWQDTISLRQRRFSGGREKPKYPAYGKTIGSYLQLLRHLIHQSGHEEKELYYAEAVDHYEAGRYHLIESKDIIRFHETVSDIESEMGHFQAAFDHLYYAAALEERPDIEAQNNFSITVENADRIVAEAGYGGEKHPYLMQHYVRLLSTMFQADEENSEAESMLAPMISMVSASFGDMIKSPHPKTQTQWKIASAIAGRRTSTDLEKRVSCILFSTASQTLLSQEKPVFSAIAVGVLAEQMWHILKGHIPGNASVAYKSMKKAYQAFLSQKTGSEKNPFAGLLPDDPILLPTALPPETCEKILRRIGY